MIAIFRVCLGAEKPANALLQALLDIRLAPLQGALSYNNHPG